MYNKLKSLYRKIIPNKVHYRLEPLLRKIIYYVFYKGENQYCPICKSSLKKFIPIYFKENCNQLCPKCGSLSRTRLLYFLIEKKHENKKLKILDFSPHRSILEFCNEKYENYISSDYEDQFYATKNYNITNIPEKENSFDLVICFHILEHIPKDEKAIKELYRILKPNGTLLVQVPLKQGKTYEDFSICKPEERLIAFGQEDHVRIYGKEDLKTLIEKQGFKVNLTNYSKNFKEKEKKYYGILDEELIFICLK